LGKYFEPKLILNLNVGDIGNISGIERTTVASCLQAIVHQISKLMKEDNVEIDLEELGKLYCQHKVVTFNPFVKSLNLNQNTYKINVKRILELENMKSNRNFYKMNVNKVDDAKEKNKIKKLELFKEVSNRFKNKMSSPTKLFKNNAF